MWASFLSWLKGLFGSAPVIVQPPTPPAPVPSMPVKPQPIPPAVGFASIDKAMPYLLVNEGGYTVDDGGPTMWGIVESDVAEYRNVPVSQITATIMKNLTVAEATAIYKIQYWDAMSLGKLSSQSIATAIFDMGVNFGIHEGALLAQRAVGVTQDGSIGPQTLAALNGTTAAKFIPSFESIVLAHYNAIVAGNPSKYSQYLAGWTNRAKRLLTLINA